MQREVIFVPHPGPQTAFINCPVDEVVYGGARGGGKTHASLGDFVIHSQEYGALAKGIFLRRTLTALKDAVRAAKKMFRGIATWRSTASEFQFNNGAVLVFNYLDRDEDAENYQGHEYTRVYVEELSQFPDPAPIKKMFATLRSADGVPCQFRASCNPGGAGHNWVKARYIDNGPYKVVTDPETGMKRTFIPARLKDNPTLLKEDPNYVNRLKSAGSPELVRAWLEGDWSIIEGAFFTEFDTKKHVITQSDFERIYNHDWKVFRSCDWGSASPFSVGWYAICPDKVWIRDQIIKRGAIIRFREYYGCRDGEFNKGLKMTAEQVGREVVRRTKEPVLYGVMDPSAFKQDGGPSIAERMAQVKCNWRRADNQRTARIGSIGGWDMCRHRLVGEREDGSEPMFFVTDRNPHFIRSVPVIQHDKKNMEDLDTDAEDHIADEWRYAMMSRPWTPKHKVEKARIPVHNARDGFWRGITFDKKEPERIRL